MTIKVKDLVEYLLKQDQQAKVILDRDGWDVQKHHKTPQDVISDRNLFEPIEMNSEKYLVINN